MAEIQTYELTEGTYNQVLEYMEKSSKKEKSEEGEVEGSIRFVHQLNGSNLYSFNDGGVLIVNKPDENQPFIDTICDGIEYGSFEQL